MLGKIFLDHAVNLRCNNDTYFPIIYTIQRFGPNYHISLSREKLLSFMLILLLVLSSSTSSFSIDHDHVLPSRYHHRHYDA